MDDENDGNKQIRFKKGETKVFSNENNEDRDQRSLEKIASIRFTSMLAKGCRGQSVGAKRCLRLS